MLFKFKTLLESSSEPDEGFLSIALVAEYGGGYTTVLREWLGKWKLTLTLM